MIIKIVIFLIIMFLIWTLFFKKTRENSIGKKKQDNMIETMQECQNCKTLVSKDEAILSNGRYFCSKECLV
ncbi:MAG: hypothetical protein B1H07_00195 [Campylobacteraceae bacterium 4484_166]|nr:MAG: hypothetical protein B1H07_00195 [Campylobacteraceae bacterium 4484_166]